MQLQNNFNKRTRIVSKRYGKTFAFSKYQKKEIRYSPANYKQIALVPISSKVIEKPINIQFIKYICIEIVNVFNDKQYNS